jgi:hypothetical protein
VRILVTLGSLLWAVVVRLVTDKVLGSEVLAATTSKDGHGVRSHPQHVLETCCVWCACGLLCTLSYWTSGFIMIPKRSRCIITLRFSFGRQQSIETGGCYLITQCLVMCQLGHP